MPLHGRVGQFVDLAPQLLGSTFRELSATGFQQRANRPAVHVLGHGHEGYVPSLSPAALRGRLDPLPNALQIGGDGPRCV
jgi:hypothetical protein